MVLVNAACSTLTAFSHGELTRHLRESWSRENESRHGDDQFPECFLKPKDLPPMVSHFPATSLLTSSLADQVRRVLARAVWLPRGITRDQAKPFPCFQYAEPELQAV